MTIFNNILIKSLYNYPFPSFCSDWKEPTFNIEKNVLGEYIKEISYGKNEFETSKKINENLKEKYTENELKEYIQTFHKLKDERRKNIVESQKKYIFKLSPVLNLSSDNDDIWGSKRQYLSGYITSLILKENGIILPPFLCCALNPTGGICGPGNNSFYNGNISSPMIIHACMHDASGYCYLYHGIGNGYNYLGTYFDFPTLSPLSGQYMGILRTLIIGLFF